MAKWADYLISAVKYDSDGSPIIELKVHVDNGETVGEAVTFTRNKVISKLDSGYSFITIVKNETKWSKGEDVRVYERLGVKYLRTDSNNESKDNLGDLPIFC